MTTPQPEPRTEAGRRLAEWLRIMRERKMAGIPLPSEVLAIEAEAARLALDGLRRAVEGLRGSVSGNPETDGNYDSGWVNRAAVLAEIDKAVSGETKGDGA